MHTYANLRHFLQSRHGPEISFSMMREIHNSDSLIQVDWLVILGRCSSDSAIFREKIEESIFLCFQHFLFHFPFLKK